MARKLETVTLKNVTKKLFEFMYDHQIYYLKPGEEWTVNNRVGQFLATKYFKNLAIVAEGGMPTPEPIENPDEGKSYFDKNKNEYGVPKQSQPWCQECGKQFKSGGQLKMHQKKHEKEAREKEMVEA